MIKILAEAYKGGVIESVENFYPEKAYIVHLSNNHRYPHHRSAKLAVYAWFLRRRFPIQQGACGVFLRCTVKR